MAQKDQVIDVTRSYIPIDPNAFPQNLISTQKEDGEEKQPPILIYEGYNFIPTSYGYRSYFGDNSKLDIAALGGRCDTMFLYQLGNLKNIIIALCENGLWYTKNTTVSGATWTQGITLSIPAVGTYKKWTHAVIDNALYVYRQGESTYWKMTPTGYTMGGANVTLTITAVAPTFLVMAGQLGIFKANASLAFWDSANSIGWSSPLDFQDFTPSLTTLAGNAIFAGIQGSIVTVKSQGDGFVIYTTKGIVGIRFISSSTLWEATTISDIAGIFSSRNVTHGLTDNEHYAYTSIGIRKVGKYNALSKAHAFESILPDIYDLFRESNDYVMLHMINGRYLFFCLINADYINGKVTFEKITVADLLYNVNINGTPYVDGNIMPNINAQTFNQRMLADRALPQDSDIYMKWAVTGIASYAAFTTPLNDYVLDGSGNHVPNVSNKTTATITNSANAKDVNLTSLVAAASPDFPNPMDNLPYIGFGSYAAGALALGTLDAKLSSYVTQQLLEWTNLISIQTANKNVFTAITPTAYAGSPDYNDTEVIIVKDYLAPFDTSDAEIQINHFIYQHPNAVRGIWTPTLPYERNYVFDILDDIDLLSGVGTVTGPTITGAGTNYAECRLRKDFLGGWKVRKTNSVKMEALLISENSELNWTYLLLGKDPVQVVDVVLETGLVALAGVAAARLTMRQSAYDLAKTGILGQSIDFVGAISGYYEIGPRVDSFGGVGDNYSLSTTIKRISDGFEQSLSLGSCSKPSDVYISYTQQGFGTSQYFSYSVDVRVDDTISATKTMVANQSNVDWGIATIFPPGNYSVNNAFNDGDTEDDQSNYTFGITYPGATFLMQDGVVEPIYPTYVGALVLDTDLKKWGKMKVPHTAILDYNSLNSTNQNVISFSNLGVDMAVLKSDNFIYNMDARPLDSYIKYGKIGYYRLGFTSVYEIHAHYRLPFTGSVTLDTSLNGTSVDTTLRSVTDFVDTVKSVNYEDQSGRWHTIKISGNYDLQYLEIRGNIDGRR